MTYVAGTQNELGHAMVTMIEPTHDSADLAEYNRWYEFDHAYSGVMIGPGAFAYRRWVATRPLKDLRYPNPSSVADPVDMGSFIAAYWFLDGSVEEHFQWSFGAMPGLVAATGHFRSGLTLAPVTAEVVSEIIRTGKSQHDLAMCRPGRLTSSSVAGNLTGT